MPSYSFPDLGVDQDLLPEGSVKLIREVRLSSSGCPALLLLLLTIHHPQRLLHTSTDDKFYDRYLVTGQIIRMSCLACGEVFNEV
jgi:hypothetical protein